MLVKSSDMQELIQHMEVHLEISSRLYMTMCTKAIHLTRSRQEKAKRMIWCLAESKRKTKRLALAKAAAIVWHYDGRSPRYLLRASACSPAPDFQITHTYIGHTKDYIPGGRGLTAATMSAIDKFCQSTTVLKQQIVHIGW